MKVVVVGANRGIGLELCKQLVETHNDVIALCRKSSSELNKINCHVIENCDVTNSKSLDEAASTLEEDSIDYLIHVSGIMTDETISNFNESTISNQFMINSIAPIQTALTFLPYLTKGAKIGMLTSRMGSITDNDSGGKYGYRMSKAALNAGAKSLAMDLKERGVTVLLLHPGWVKTDMTNNTGLLTTKESVSGLLEIMKSKGLNETGTFWHTNGENLNW